MENASMKANRSNPTINAILAATFPEYRGRRITVRLATRPVIVEMGASGGTYDKIHALSIDGRTGAVPRLAPWAAAAIAAENEGIAVPAGCMLVVWSHYCGTDCGITIHVAAPTVPALGADVVAGLLPASPEG